MNMNMNMNTDKSKIVFCIVPREDAKGIFYTVDTVTKGGSGGSTPFEQKPTILEVEAFLLSVYPEMVESVWHTNYWQSPDEIAEIYF